jgi:hypothetical protein
MSILAYHWRHACFTACVAGFGVAAPTGTFAQQRSPAEPKNWTAAEDHRQMMEQLGITALRPGPSGNEQDPNHANYDETKANPFPKLPDVLTLANGSKVATAQQWTRRRAEIVEDFEREVFGRVPKTTPTITWSVTATDTGTLGGRHVVARQVTGHVDNSSAPSINVDIVMTLVLPSDAKQRVPVMIMFGGGGLAQALGRPAPAGARGFTFRRPPRAVTRRRRCS